MHLIDLRERLGPYWAAYQATRHRDKIIDDPDYVPDWFLTKLARERVAAARVALDQLGADQVRNSDQHELYGVWRALRTLEEFLRSGGNDIDQRNLVVAGLLGAQEIETAREQSDYARGVLDRVEPGSAERAARQRRERTELAKAHLRERGITTSAQLVDLHRHEDAERERTRQAQWRALDEIAEEGRAKVDPADLPT